MAPEVLKFAATFEDDELGLDREEYDDGVCALALPTRTPGNDNYAIAVSMSSRHFKERLPPLREALRKTQKG